MRYILVMLLMVFMEFGMPVGEAAADNVVPNLSPEQWVGQTFLFHPLPKDRQEAGYQIFKIADADRGWTGERSVRLPYNEHVFKQVRITEVIKFPAGTGYTEYIVYMTEKNTGMKLVGRTMRGQLEGLMLEADLKQARSQLLGKHIYIRERVLRLEDSLAGVTTPQVVSVKIGSAIKVVDIYAGIRTDEPIWLVVLVDGKRAIVPIAYSWSNINVSIWKQTPAWQDDFFTEDPRATFGWSKEVWDKIDAGLVDEGMSKKQVELSWGFPLSISEKPDGSGNSVWSYGSSVLTFKGDTLVVVERLSMDSMLLP